jgi:predicted RND superfamily exporter protein
MIIAGIFAFIILIVATGNIIQAVISVLCVAIVIVSVLAIMQLQGWEIGVSESLNTVIIIGFSVDYVIHLSADYMHSSQQIRSGKMKQAFKEMGVSILSGAITTFGSGVFLFGGKIILFNKFAILICGTIIISFLTAMLLFASMMHIMGPQEGFGDIKNLCKKKD